MYCCVVAPSSEINPLGILDSSTALWSAGKAPDPAIINPQAADVDSLQYLNSEVAQNIAALNRLALFNLVCFIFVTYAYLCVYTYGCKQSCK